MFVIPEMGCLFSFSNLSQLFGLYDLKQQTKQCVTYGSVLRNGACFFAKDKSDRQKMKSRHIICLKIPVRFFLSTKHLIYLFAKDRFCEEIVIF